MNKHLHKEGQECKTGHTKGGAVVGREGKGRKSRKLIWFM
jgi:hypothetical protein